MKLKQCIASALVAGGDVEFPAAGAGAMGRHRSHRPYSAAFGSTTAPTSPASGAEHADPGATSVCGHHWRARHAAALEQYCSKLSARRLGDVAKRRGLRSVADVAATVNRNAIVTPDTMANFSPAEIAVLKARRNAVALNEALARAELKNVSERFDAIQQLINAIPTAQDEKGILDLQARIAAEQGMLQNESSKLHVLYEAAQSQAQNRAAARR